MRRFAVSVIALALAVGLSSAVPKPEVEISNYPIDIGDQLEVEGIARPLPSFPGFAPETDPVFELDPVLESDDVTAPILISLNPCDACFEYMTALIDQLTEVAVPEAIPVHPALPEIDWEIDPVIPEVGRPLPETVPEDIRPLPVPVAPEVEVNPIPIPILPEVEVRPVPVPVAPEVEIRPIPFPIVIEQ